MLAEARDNVAFGTRRVGNGLAEPDGVARRADHDLWNDEPGRVPHRAQDRARQGARAADAGADPRCGRRRSPTTPTWSRPRSVDDHGHPPAAGARTAATSACRTLADDGDETQTGLRLQASAVARRSTSTVQAAGDAVERATRCSARQAAEPAAHGRARSVRDRAVPRRDRVDAERRGVLKGRSPVRRPRRRAGRRPRRHARRRPDEPAAYTATDVDGEGLAARRNVLIEDGVLRSSCTSYSAGGRHGVHRQRRARRVPGHARRRRLALQLQPGHRGQAELVAGVDDGLLVQIGAGLHSGVNPISGDFSVGAAGPADPRRRARPSRCASSRSPRRCSGCCSTWSRSAATSSGCRCAPPA